MEADPERIFRLAEQEGPSKVCPLSQAIDKHIKPGMTLSISREANAGLLELCRLFWKRNPGFTLITGGIGNLTVLPLYGGLTKKVITSNISHPYPLPGPIKLVQDMEQRHEVEMEIWSIYVLQLRFMAAVLGLPFMPTRSMIGSDLAQENRQAFQELEDPFGEGRVGVVKALNPDVGIVHGLAADAYGNTILPIPWSEIWGCRAGKTIIVTVEKVVSTDFIREHASLVKLPGYLVTTVSPAPLSSHPGGLRTGGLRLEGIEGYDSDYQFMEEFRTIVNDPHLLEQWVQENVLIPTSHQERQSLLGEQRVRRLKESLKEPWQHRVKGVGLPPDEGYMNGEMLVVAAARKLAELAEREKFTTLGAGAGTASLAASLAYYMLAERGVAADLINGGGLYGYAPRPGRPFMGDLSHNPTAKMMGDTVEAWGMVVGGGGNRCLSALGAAQVDRFGNINSTQMGHVRLFGGGGASDAAAAQEIVLVIAEHSLRRLVEKVPYVTVPGEKVRTLITPLAIFEKRDGELTLTACLLSEGDMAEKVAQIQQNTGWQIKVAEQLEQVPPPTPSELLTIRYMDPHGFYTRR